MDIVFYKKLKIALIAGLALFTNSIFSQDFKWRTGFSGFFDNREFFNEYVEPQTMGGSRAFAAGGIALNDNQEFLFGADVLYEFGSKPKSLVCDPIIYFHFENRPVNLYLGSFPRHSLIALPNVLQTDTFQYYRPNVQGIFVEFRKHWGSHSAWLDWTSRQTEVDRETFLIGGTGKLNSGVFFYRHDFIMMHYAGTMIPDSSDHIRDNGGLAAVIGVNLSSKTVFDSLSLSTGYTFSYDRRRNVYDMQYYNGSLTELNMFYKFAGIRSTLYLGDGQVQMVGDGLYKANFYERTDLYWQIFNKRNITGKVQFSFHFLKDLVDVSQSFTIYVDLSGKKPIHSKIDF